MLPTKWLLFDLLFELLIASLDESLIKVRINRVRNTIINFKTAIILMICSVLLSGCGFKLRNDFELDDKFRKIRVLNIQQHSQLTSVLIDRLDVYQVDVINKTMAKNHHEFKVYTIGLAPERMERKLLSLFPSGQVAEYELLYFCDYQVQSPEGETKQYSFQLSREYQDDPDQVLAKSRELDLILSEIRAEAADRIIRQLSAQQRKS